MEELVFGGAFLRREICVSKSIWLGKLTVFSLFYFVFEGKFQVQASWGAYIRRGDLTEGFLRYEFGGLIFGGGYFRNFTVCKTNTSGVPPPSSFLLVYFFSPLFISRHSLLCERLEQASTVLITYVLI